MNIEKIIRNSKSYVEQYVSGEISLDEAVNKTCDDMNESIYNAVIEELKNEGIEIG